MQFELVKAYPEKPRTGFKDLTEMERCQVREPLGADLDRLTTLLLRLLVLLLLLLLLLCLVLLLLRPGLSARLPLLDSSQSPHM
jgi:hypothetical protein